jgi:RecB family exonuclease
MMLGQSAGGESEIKLEAVVVGRRVRAIADRVWNNHVLDIKTGAAPNKSQLGLGNMPQLPLEAHMRGARVMQFLQLKNNDVRLIQYDGEIARAMIDASVQKVSELFGRYSKDGEPYEYRENSEPKYKAYDDLARAND